MDTLFPKGLRKKSAYFLLVLVAAQKIAGG
jgi:hypothetical protein